MSEDKKIPKWRICLDPESAGDPQWDYGAPMYLQIRHGHIELTQSYGYDDIPYFHKDRLGLHSCLDVAGLEIMSVESRMDAADD